MRHGVFLALFLALMMSGVAVASDSATGVSADTVLTQQRGIRDEVIARKGRYKDMGETERRALLEQQDTVFNLLQGKQNSNELTESDRVVLFNSLEAIEAAINNAKNEQMVCEFVRKVGSNRPERVCKTYGQREKERTDAQKNLEQRGACNRTGCVGN